MCRHNDRCRYTTGFYCHDCDTFFDKDSDTYRSGELLSSLWMVLHNINVQRYRDGLEPDEEVSRMVDKIGIGEKHDDYESIIAEAEVIMSLHGVGADSASVELCG